MVMYGANLQYGQNPYGQQYGQQPGYGYGYQQQGYPQQGYGMGAPVQPGALVPYGLSPQGAAAIRRVLRPCSRYRDQKAECLHRVHIHST